MATGATEKPKSPNSEQMTARAWVCPGSWDTWGATSRTEGPGSSQTCLSLDTQTQPGPAQQLCLCRPRVGGRGAHPIQRSTSGQCHGLRGPGCLFWLSCQLPCPRAPHSHPGGWSQFEGTLTRAKATLTREVRQRPILRASVKCLVRSTYRPRTSAPRTPNPMKRDAQKPANSWRRRGGWEHSSSGHSATRAQEEASSPGCTPSPESPHRVTEQHLSPRQDDTESSATRLAVCRPGGCGTSSPGGASSLCHPTPGIQQFVKGKSCLLQMPLGASVPLKNWEHASPNPTPRADTRQQRAQPEMLGAEQGPPLCICKYQTRTLLWTPVGWGLSWVGRWERP